MAPTFAPDHLLAGRYRIVQLLGVGADRRGLRRRGPLPAAPRRGEGPARRPGRPRGGAPGVPRPHHPRLDPEPPPHRARLRRRPGAGAIFMISEYLAGADRSRTCLRPGGASASTTARGSGATCRARSPTLHEHGFVLGRPLALEAALRRRGASARERRRAGRARSSAYRERMTLDDARYLSPEQAIGEPPRPQERRLRARPHPVRSGDRLRRPSRARPPRRSCARASNAPLPVRLELGTLDMVLAQAAVPDPRLRLDAEQFASRLGAVVGDSAPPRCPGGRRSAAARAVRGRRARAARSASARRRPTRSRPTRWPPGPTRVPGAPSCARARDGSRAGATPRFDASASTCHEHRPSGPLGLPRRGHRARRRWRSGRAPRGSWASSPRSTPCPTVVGKSLTQAWPAPRGPTASR